MSRRGPALLAGVSVALVAVAALAGSGAATAAPPPPLRVPLTTQTLVCPQVATVLPHTASSVSSVLPGGGAHVVVTSLSGQVAPVQALGTAGTHWTAPDGTHQPFLVTATGSRAGTLAAQQTTITNAGQTRALSAVACGPATTSAWFVGPSTAIGARSVLHLINPGPTTASATVTPYSASGTVLAGQAPVVSVPPGRDVEVNLLTVAPGQAALAVHVTATAGRLAMAVVDTESAGLTARGSDWVPAATGPARSVLLPGGVGGTTATLALLAPGSGALARVALLTPAGTLTPLSLQSIPLAVDQLVLVRLPAALLRGPFAVQVSADHPVVAGVRMLAAGSGGTADLAWLAGVAPLSGPTGVPDVRSSGAATTTLALAAPGSAGSVTLTQYAAGTPSVRTIAVAAGSLVSVRLPRLGPLGWAVVTPTAASGPVVAGWSTTVTDSVGELLSAGPLASGTTVATLPAAAAAVGAGLGP